MKIFFARLMVFAFPMMFMCLLSTDRGLSAAATPEAETFTQTGYALEFTAPLAEGGVFDLGQFKNHVVLINFWATWCGPCRYEIPALVKLQNDLGQRDFAVIGVSMDESASVVPSFLKRLGVNYPVVMNTQELWDFYGPIYYIPTSYLIGKDGKIVRKYGGYTNESELRRDIEQYLV